MHAFKLRSRDETGDAEMGTTRQKQKTKKRGSDRKRNFCSNGENLCEWLWNRISLSNTLEGNLPEEWGLQSRGETRGTQLTALTSRYTSKGHDYFTHFLKKIPVVKDCSICLLIFWPCHTAGRTFPDRGSKLCPQHWKCGVRTIGLLGSPQHDYFRIGFDFLIFPSLVF